MIWMLCVSSALAADTTAAALVEAGSAAESRRDFDRAVELFSNALHADPRNEQAAISLKRAQFEAAMVHVNRGLLLRQQGDLPGALAEFERAESIDPSSFAAREEAARIREVNGKLPSAGKLADVPKLTPTIDVFSEMTINAMPIPILFQTLGKLAGIDVAVDAGVSPGGKTYTVHLTGKTVEQALDEAAILTRTFWKPLSPNSIFVAMDTPQTRHDFEDQQLAAFYLHNVTTPAEMNEMANTLRLMLDLRRITVYPSQNALIVRGSEDQVRAARLLIDDLDKAKPEVVVDVLVMETSRSRSRQISTALAGSAALGVPITFTPRNPVSSGSSSSVAQTSIQSLKHLSASDFSVALPGLNLALDASDSQTKILQSPQVRASDGQKASLKIGQRVPLATSSLTTAATGQNGSLLGSTQISYADIGVNVELTPHVHSRDELTLHIDIDISSVADHADVGGISEPIIGRRTVSHEVRLREGQATLLAGLTENSETKHSTGIPGLSRVPVLRHLFANHNSDGANSDLLIVLVPHLVKLPTYSPANLEPIYIGTDGVVRVRPER
jgi:general secretion pathway protein D